MESKRRFNDAELDALRLIGDPIADQVIRKVFAHGEVDAVNHLLGAMIKNDGLPPKALPGDVAEYLERSAELPAWADPAQIKAGERIFMRYGLYTLGALLCASLPECYTMRNGVRVLAATQKLEAHVVRRLFETAQMVVDVMCPGGLTPGGRGIRTAQKVRLMHASVRHLITDEPRRKEREPSRNLGEALEHIRWDPAWGLPGNQEDMAFTLLTFSHVVLRSLGILGVKLTRDEQQAYIHCWNVVGYLMGIREELLAQGAEDAAALFEQIKARQGGASSEGRALTSGLEAFLGSMVPYKPLAPHIQHTTIRFLVGDETADMLGVEPSGVLERTALNMMLRAVGIAESFIQRSANECEECVLCKCFSAKLVLYLLRLKRGGDRGMFYIPQSIVDDWGVAEHQGSS